MAAAAWITGAGILAIYAVQIALLPLLGGLFAAALGYLAVIALMIALARRRGFGLGIRPVVVRFWVAAVMIGIAAWYVDLRIVERLELHGEPESLEHIVAVSPLSASLIGLALLPAIGEELVFRGVLARAIAARSVILAIVLSAVVFSAYHLDPPQIAGTFPLGLALGVLAVRSHSIVPGMITHALNNAIVLVLARVELPGVTTLLTRHANGALVGAGALMVGGVLLAGREA
ncbi:MAG: type II CAAX endopeptidase family protein [Kofleriaceae bacterium]